MPETQKRSFRNAFEGGGTASEGGGTDGAFLQDGRFSNLPSPATAARTKQPTASELRRTKVNLLGTDWECKERQRGAMAVRQEVLAGAQ